MPAKNTTPKMMCRAGELRRSQTEAEARLWTHLRSHRMNGIHFRRQYAIGNYMVDFCAVRRKLIIELDGSQHIDKLGRDLIGFRNALIVGFHVHASHFDDEAPD